MVADVKSHLRFSGIYWANTEDGTRKLATRNLSPGRTVYREHLIKVKGVEYRVWDPFRSKLAAAILRGLKKVPLKPDCKVLYLGAASGTTVSHVSDIVGGKGHVFCVEFAPRTMRELVNNVCRYRKNVTPILEDARKPDEYVMFMEDVDSIYCDIAQPEQARVMADNADLFLKAKGWTMLSVKSQSIDVTKKPVEVYNQEANTLETRGFKIKDMVQLEPYVKAHAMIVSQAK